MATFAQIVKDWADSIPGAMVEAHDNAVARTFEESNRAKSEGGLMPVDTGRLQNSICVNGVVGKDNIRAGIENTEIPGQHELSYNAPYANFVEGGTSRQAPQPFLRTALLKYPLYLSEEARKV